MADEAAFNPESSTPSPSGDVRRFQLVSCAAIAVAAVPYFWVLWVLWAGKVNVLRTSGPATVYDVQARAILHGHLSLPSGSISIEGFVHNGRTYTYFGILPSLVRIPVLLFTHSLDGQLTALSIGVSWLVTGVFGALLLWRIRVVVRGDGPLGWAEAVSYGVLLASVLVGSVLVFLASQPNVYQEDLAWSVALSCGSLFALLGVVERPSWARLSVAAVLLVLTNLNRSTTGYSCILGSFMIAAWFASGRAGPDRRRWAPAVLGAGLVALAAGCAIDLAKFDLLFGFPASEQVLYKSFGLGQINGGHYFSLRFLPSALQAYVAPGNLQAARRFPFLTLPANPSQLVAHTRLFQRGPTASAVATMPLLFIAGVWGTVAAFRRQRDVEVRALRILLVAAAGSAAAVMIFGWIDERFVADFMPLLILASMIGMVDLWRRLHGRSRRERMVAPAVMGFLALFGLVANVGSAIIPNGNWSPTELAHFVRGEIQVGNVTSHPQVARGSYYPSTATVGELYVKGKCEALYVSDANGPVETFFPKTTWLLVEKAPHTPICHSLLGAAGGSG